jgi:hypothetical protein
MMYRASPPRARDRSRARRPAVFRPAVEALEDRAVPTSLSWVIDTDPGGWGLSIVTDATGNVYVAGRFAGNVDFDPAHPNTDGLLRSTGITENGFVVKYAADGTFQWVRGTNGPGDDQGLAVDGSGNIYVAGSFSVGDTFGAFTPTSGDTFVTKLDTAGNFDWVQTYTGGTGDNTHVALDGSGNVYVARTINPSGVDVNANTFIIVSKLDPATGATVWNDQFGNTGSMNGNTGMDVKADATGNVFVTGTFTGTVDFDPGPASHTLTSPKWKGEYVQEGFVLSLTTGNNFRWVKEIAAMPSGLAIDSADNVYTTGASGDWAQLGAGGPLNITKLSASGAQVWSKNFANGSPLENPPADAYGVALDSSGNVYTTGYFTGTANFNPGGAFNLTSAGGWDSFVSKWNANGAFLWAGRMGGTGDDAAYGIAVDPTGNIYTTGFFTGTANFDPGGVHTLTGGGVFVSKLSPSSPQLSAQGVAPGGEAAAPALTPAELAPIAHEAIAHWAATGLTARQLALLRQVQFSIQDLSGYGALGLTALNTPVVVLDATADGWGWFIDPTPADDTEFGLAVGGGELQAGPGSPAYGHVDLLTVVEHELGHVLGLDDIAPGVRAHDLMTTTLPLGTRRLLTPGTVRSHPVPLLDLGVALASPQWPWWSTRRRP